MTVKTVLYQEGFYSFISHSIGILGTVCCYGDLDIINVANSSQKSFHFKRLKYPLEKGQH